MFIVSAHRPDLLPELRREFATDDVEMVVDRRQKADRPREDAGQRPGDRRKHGVDSELEYVGFAVVVPS